MIAFELSVNGRIVKKVGVGEFGILNASVRRVRLQNHKGQLQEELHLLTSGLEQSNQDYLSWDDFQLAVGDVVTIQVVDEEGFVADSPAERTSSSVLPPGGNGRTERAAKLITASLKWLRWRVRS